MVCIVTRRVPSGKRKLVASKKLHSAIGRVPNALFRNVNQIDATEKITNHSRESDLKDQSQLQFHIHRTFNRICPIGTDLAETQCPVKRHGILHFRFYSIQTHFCVANIFASAITLSASNRPRDRPRNCGRTYNLFISQTSGSRLSRSRLCRAIHPAASEPYLANNSRPSGGP